LHVKDLRQQTFEEETGQPAKASNGVGPAPNADHFHSFLILDQHAQSGPNDGVIFNY